MIEFGLLILAVLVVLFIAGLNNKGKPKSKYNLKSKSTIENQQKHQEIDEQITVILPIINNDKK